MTKKHFIELADRLRPYRMRVEADLALALADGNALDIKRAHDRKAMMYDLLCELASFCKAQNPAFMHERWMSYIAGQCGPNGGAVRDGGAR